MKIYVTTTRPINGSRPLETGPYGDGACGHEHGTMDEAQRCARSRKQAFCRAHGAAARIGIYYARVNDAGLACGLWGEELEPNKGTALDGGGKGSGR
jgi:hypothetical protein